MCATVIVIACLHAPVPPERAAEEGPAAIERKLHGAWSSDMDCVGGLTLNANETFRQERHGPGGATSTGTWAVRWDALPPTLVLDCKESTDRDYVRRYEVKV